MNQSTLRKLIREEIAKATNENVDTMTMKRGIKNVINDILSSLDSLDIDALQNLSSAINRAADMVKATALSGATFQGDPRDGEIPSRGDWRGKTSPSA
jgi:ribosome maturation factor RimP